ncbi:unnamed protein product [Brassicogethes aeneus]|uniref:NACHT domain-containing protein n=1 Tax=Brassicogethes aeneus TaxID=1431903 RepID=A0A9P0AQ25_BRAAE|nr:unnamed protein product [Brassicogethes aeneus]
MANTVKELLNNNKAYDYGKDYEIGIFAYLAIKSTLSSEIEDFKIAINAIGHKNLDDIVLQVYEKETLKEIYLFQLKHKLKVNKSVKQFRDFNKYETSYNQLKNIYNTKLTSILFTDSKSEANKMIEQNDNNNNFLNYINTQNSESRIYKPKVEDSDFYQNCYILTDQVHAKKLEEYFYNNVFERNVPKEVIKKILEFFKISMAERKSPFCKEDVLIILKEVILHPCVVFFGENKERTEKIKNATEVLHIFNRFPLTVVSKDLLSCFVKEKVETYFKIKIKDWKKELSDEEEQSLVYKNEKLKVHGIRRKPFGELTHEGLVYLLWNLNEIPLIVKYTEEYKKQIDYLLNTVNHVAQRSIVLVCEQKIVPPDYNKLKVFKTLGDLDGNNVLNAIQISLQKKAKIKLKDLTGKEFLRRITPTTYLEIINRKSFGIDFVETDKYISRKLDIHQFKSEVLRKNKYLFVIHEDRSQVNLEDYIKNIESYETKNIVYSNKSFYETIKLVQPIKRPWLCLSKHENNYVCYLHNGCINDRELREYQVSNVVNEKYLLETKFPINLICGTAGMGKTTLLRNIERNIKNNYFTVYLNIPEHVVFLKSFNETSDINSFLEYIAKCQLHSESDKNLLQFMKDLLHHLLKTNQMVLLFDGIDEVDFDCQIIKHIYTKLGATIFITTRGAKKIELENILSVQSIELKEFDQQDQTKYLNESDVKPNFIKNILKCVMTDFLGIPLILKLVIDIHPSITYKENVDIIYIFDTYIKQYTECYQMPSFFTRFYEKVAFLTFFDYSLISDIFDMDDLINDIQDFKISYKGNKIISGFLNNETALFIHRSFAEFLCAQYLHKIAKKVKDKFKVLYELLYTEELLNVRYFFDLMATRERVHHDLFHKKNISLSDLEEVDVLGRTPLHLVMGYGGRYTYPYEVTGVKNFGKQQNKIHIIQKQFSLDEKLLDRILQLMKNNNLDIKEDLLGYLPHEYAFLSRSFMFLNIICQHFPLQVSIPPIYDKALFVYIAVWHNLYNVFKEVIFKLHQNNFELSRDFQLSFVEEWDHHNTAFTQSHIKDLRNQVTSDWEKTILHVAAEKNHCKIIKFILEQNILHVDTLSLSNKTAYYFAAKAGKSEAKNVLKEKGANINLSICDTVKPKEIIDLSELIKKGIDFETIKNKIEIHKIDINEYDVDNCTLLYRAVECSHIKVINYLLKSKAKINKKSKSNLESVLHCASAKSTPKVAEILVNQGMRIEDLDKDGWTSLFHAVNSNNTDMINWLINKKADFNHLDCKRRSILHIMAWKCKPDLADLFIKKNRLDVNCQDLNGWTPLFSAIYGRNWNMVKWWLTNCDVNINYKDKKGMNIMHMVAKHGNTEIARYIYEKYPEDIPRKVKNENKYSKTPYMIISNEILNAKENTNFDEKEELKQWFLNFY